MTNPGHGLIDWDLAVRVGSRIAGEGPETTPSEAARVVDELRADAERSTGLVAEFTGLEADENRAPRLVVDRRGWVQANAEGFRTVLDPLAAKVLSRKGPPTGVTRALGSRVTGTEVGVMLGFLGSKVLGQFDPFSQPDGRLLLVAPNVVHVERELQVDPRDFRLWVCLHEETHRVQFTAVPWMREHLFSQVEALGAAMEPSALTDDLVGRITRAISSDGGSLLEILGTEEQREVLDRVTGMMSLLEGHADVVMDGVGPSVIPSVERIRAKFDQRRKGVGTLDRLLRRLLGLEAKMAQYRDGAKFVRAVIDQVGMDDFNAVFAAPDNLPTKAEISSPASWVARVHG